MQKNKKDKTIKHVVIRNTGLDLPKTYHLSPLNASKNNMEELKNQHSPITTSTLANNSPNHRIGSFQFPTKHQTIGNTNAYQTLGSIELPEEDEQDISVT